MRTTPLTVCVILLSSGCGATLSTTAHYDAAAEASLTEYVGAMMRALQDERFLDFPAAAPEAVVFDVGEQGQPVAAVGPDAIDALMQSYARFAEQADIHTEVDGIDCHATVNFGYCIIQFAQTITAGGQTMGPYHNRVTLVARRDGDSWTWTHWHASLSQLPSP